MRGLEMRGEDPFVNRVLGLHDTCEVSESRMK